MKTRAAGPSPLVDTKPRRGCASAPVSALHPPAWRTGPASAVQIAPVCAPSPASGHHAQPTPVWRLTSAQHSWGQTQTHSTHTHAQPRVRDRSQMFEYAKPRTHPVIVRLPPSIGLFQAGQGPTALGRGEFPLVAVIRWESRVEIDRSRLQNMRTPPVCLRRKFWWYSSAR